MDGELFDGGSAENKMISLSEKTGYIEGFDKDLYGVTVGTVVNTEVTFPADYYEELAGKKAVFKITVRAVKTQTMIRGIFAFVIFSSLSPFVYDTPLPRLCQGRYLCFVCSNGEICAFCLQRG